MGVYGRTLKLGTDKDIYFDDTKNLAMTDGTDKVGQDMRIILTTLKQGNIFDITQGVNFEAIRGADTPELVQDELMRALMTYRFLGALQDFQVGETNIAGRDRQWSVTFSIMSETEYLAQVGE